MPNFLTLIQGLTTSPPKPAKTRLEPRRARREKARQAEKTAKT